MVYPNRFDTENPSEVNIKNTAILIAISAACIFTIKLQKDTIKELKQDNEIYKNNNTGLLQSVNDLRQDSASQTKQVQALQLTVKEYKEYRKEDAEVIKDLKIELKRVKSISKQKFIVHAPIEAPVFTITQPDTHDSIQKVVMKNPHISFDGILKNDSLKASVELPVNVYQVIHKIPKHKFLWWKWGCKGFKQVITTDNPYVKLKFNEYIEFR